MAKDKITSKAKKKQEAIELGKRIKQKAIESGLLRKTTMQDRVKSVHRDMMQVAESLELIIHFIYGAEYDQAHMICDLVPSMLEERAAHVRERADELFLELEVEPPGE